MEIEKFVENITVCLWETVTCLLDNCVNAFADGFLVKKCQLNLVDEAVVEISEIHIKDNMFSSIFSYQIKDFYVDKITVDFWNLQIGVDGVRITTDTTILNVRTNYLYDEIDEINEIEKYNEIDEINEIEKYNSEIDTSVAVSKLKIVIKSAIESFLVNVLVINIEDVIIKIITEIGISNNSPKHTMRLNITNISKGVSCVEARQVSFFICENTTNLHVPMMKISGKTENQLLILCVEGNNEFDLCGDSYFIINFFLQTVFENQRYLLKQNNSKIASNRKTKSQVVIKKELEEVLFDYDYSYRKQLDTNTTANTKYRKRENLLLKNLELRIDNVVGHFHHGQDLNQTRKEDDKFTVKCWDFLLLTDFTTDNVSMETRQIQTTVGNVDQVIRYNMQKFGEYWDVHLQLSSVNIRVTQTIIESLVLLFDFNNIFSEYDILYNQQEDIKFRQFLIDDVHLKTIYYSKPTDLNNLLRGNLKAVLSLIPSCDIKLTLPSVIMKYQIGWEDVMNCYLHQLYSTQKFKCFKKVFVGIAKRRFKRNKW